MSFVFGASGLSGLRCRKMGCKKFIWVSSPKVASTTLWKTLAKFNLAPHEYDGHNIPYKELVELHGIKETADMFYKWAFVRNPYDRLVSTYFHLNNAHNFRFYENFDDFILNDFYDKSNGSLSIQNSKIRTASALRNSWHLVPQVYYLKNFHGNLFHYDFIGRVENMDNDWREVIQNLGVKLPKDSAPLPTYNGRANDRTLKRHMDPEPEPDPFLQGGRTRDYSKYFEGKNADIKIEIVNTIYGEDFIKLGYSSVPTRAPTPPPLGWSKGE